MSPEQMAVVVEKLLSVELANRGVPDAASVCVGFASQLRAMRSSGANETPDSVFQRLGG